MPNTQSQPDSLPDAQGEMPVAAGTWAAGADFNPEQVDCTTAVVLKVLDRKCKMSIAEQAAILAVYDTVVQRPAHRFAADVHHTIAQARRQATPALLDEIHRLRVHAEATIPKPVMKRFKAFLRQNLFA